MRDLDKRERREGGRERLTNKNCNCTVIIIIIIMKREKKKEKKKRKKEKAESNLGALISFIHSFISWRGWVGGGG